MRGTGGLSVQWSMLAVLLGFAFVLLAILGFAHAYALEEDVRAEVSAACAPAQTTGCAGRPLSPLAEGYLAAAVTERYVSSALLVAGTLLFCLGYVRSRRGEAYAYRPPRY